MKRIWIKLYLEILDDIEFGELPEFIKWRAIELFLVAGENGNDGLLPSVARLAWRLRLDEVKIAETLSALTQVGVVHETPEGWVVTHFPQRQQAMTEAERAKLYRMRHKIVTKGATNSDEADVTPSSSTSFSFSDSDSVSVSEEDRGVGEGETTPNVFAVYQANIGMITPMIADGLNADIDLYSEDWVITAIEYATRQEKRSLSYVEGCLRGWKRDGLAKPPAINAERTKTEKGSRANFLRKLAEA